jgi:DNA-binding transcriptional ArsR family regulator
MSQVCQEVIVHPENVATAKKIIASNEPSELAVFFKLLANETRIKILLALLEVELCVCDLVSTLNIPQSSISHQLRYLRDHRFVKFRRSGKQVYYSLEKEHLQTILEQTADHLKEEQNSK